MLIGQCSGVTFMNSLIDARKRSWSHDQQDAACLHVLGLFRRLVPLASGVPGWGISLNASSGFYAAQKHTRSSLGAGAMAETEQLGRQAYYSAYDVHKLAPVLKANPSACNWIEKDDRHATPLFMAAMRGDSSSVKLLLKAGADINHRDDEGQTALFRAAFDDHRDALKALLEGGADVRAVDKKNHTALEYAVIREHHKAMSLLIAAKADVNHVSHDSLLGHAARFGDVEAVHLLLSAGANVNLRDKDGRTPLMCGVAHPRVVKQLIDKKADVNSRAPDGLTPLLLAATVGALESVRSLLKAGADRGARDANGKTPLDLALENKHAEVASTLQRLSDGSKRGSPRA